jgi:glutamate/tyrosine decarboxylase-like PLP-dependent enzyme
MADDKNSQYYPYADRYGVLRGIPEKGRPREDVLRELSEIAQEENAFWQTGKCSGTMYCGDMEHYAFLKEAFGLYGHVNALQRDMCPSATRFEGEIIAMTLDMLHADAVGSDASPCGTVTSGGTDSILHALLAYREKYRDERGITQPEIILPETAHPAFRKGAHLFGIQVVDAPIDPETTCVRVDFVGDHITPNTIALVGSAGNYGYGTVDPIDQLSDLALDHGLGLHVDGCLGGFILPWGQELGYDIPVFDFQLRGVTSISTDTHKYGYAPTAGLVGRKVPLAEHRGKPLGRTDCRGVGVDGESGTRRLPPLREADLRDGICHAGRRAKPPRAPDPGQADVLLLVPVR